MIERVETPEQIDRVMELALRFHRHSVWADVSVDESASRANFETLVAGAGAIWLSESGYCAIMEVPLWFNPAVKVAMELFWYAEDGCGPDLREASEEWARERGFPLYQMSCQTNERVEGMIRLMRRHGHVPRELIFFKELV